MSSVFVTSHLVVGDPPTTISGHIVEAKNAQEAVQIIEHGGTAVLPSGAWEEAEDVLRLFGADEDHVRFQVGSARRPSGGTITAHP